MNSFWVSRCTPGSSEDASPKVSQLIERASLRKIVAIGETGLDYYRQDGDLEWQRSRFRTHIRRRARVQKTAYYSYA